MIQAIIQQAEKEYPQECCGILFGPAGEPGKVSTFRACRNVQDEYHKQDLKNFPRSSKTAYIIEPKELLSIQKEIRGRGESVRVIYHSHIDTGAYFSEEDARIAAPEGESAYPGVDYLVVSVTQGKAKDWNLFHWDPKTRKFSV